MLSWELFEALICERKAFPIGKKRTWGKHEYMKVAAGVWERLPKVRTIQAPHGRQATVTDDVVRRRAEAEMDPLKFKRTVAKLKQTVKEGKLEKGMSAKAHIKEAKSISGRHVPGYARFSNGLNKVAPEATTTRARLKTQESILGKLSRKPEDYSRARKMTDISAGQIVLKSNAEVRKVVARLKKKYEVVEDEDFITNPQKGDYRSHHLLIKDEDGLVKEIQVRTERQDDHANWGHNVYKPLSKRQENLVAKYQDQIDAYSKGTADYFDALDNGREPAKPRPDCPPAVDAAVGCVP